MAKWTHGNYLVSMGKCWGMGPRRIWKKSKVVESRAEMMTLERCAAKFHAEPICQKSDISVLDSIGDKTVAWVSGVFV